jgi:tubulin-specific chaperone E
LQVLLEELGSAPKAFLGVKDLELDEMLLSWEDICLLAEQFKSLKVLTASSNCLKSLQSPLSTPNLASLTLEYNQFTNLADLAPLSQLVSLENLLLKGNQISINYSTTSEKPVFGSKLQYIDLSYNQVNSWSFVDELAEIFPGMTRLRLQHNPIYDTIATGDGPASSVDDGFMLVLARLGNLKSLNFSPISDVDRRNAEMFYLSRIGKEMAAVPESEEHTVTFQHKRYAELCEKYDKPNVVRRGPETVSPDFLEARLIQFTFYMQPNTLPDQNEVMERKKEIPKGFDIYRVKGIVGRLFDVKPLCVRLIWETGEYDPVAGYEEEEIGSSDDDDEDTTTIKTKERADEDKGKWMKREVEIEDSTRQVGYCVEGLEARIRVEVTQM